MLAHVQAFRPDMIGLQTKSPLIPDTVSCVRLIRQGYTGWMVAGGHHATALPEATLQRIPGLNGVVVGEGEMAMAQLADGEDPEAVPGLWWKQNGEVVPGRPAQQIQDLDQLPFPALDLLDMAYYSRRNFNPIRGHYLSSVSLLSSRGCPRRCDFCCESLTYGQGVRSHSPEYVLEWMNKTLKDHPVEGIYFLDSDFLLHHGRVTEICEGILSQGLQRKVKWAIQARTEGITREVLKLLKRAGCVLIEMGVESPFQDHLDALHKCATVSSAERAIAFCREQGMTVYAYLMTGFPGEGIGDLQRMVLWLKRVKPHLFGVSELSIHPGTRLYEAHGNRFFEQHDWDEKAVKQYYGTRFLTRVSNAERERWKRETLDPFQARLRRLQILKANGPLRWLIILRQERHRFPPILKEYLQWVLGHLAKP
jgi:radical SAM superfamily enzyme YgiQ (UPF0313 family)